MWIIDNNNTNDIIKKVANTYEINEKSYDNEIIINENKEPKRQVVKRRKIQPNEIETA